MWPCHNRKLTSYQVQISYWDYAYKGQFLSKQIELPPALLPHKDSIALHTTVNLTLSYKMALVYIINDKKTAEYVKIQTFSFNWLNSLVVHWL